MKRAMMLLAVCSLLLGGCSSNAVIRGDAHRARAVRSVVVLPFSDEGVAAAPRDRALVGRTAEPAVGEMVSQTLAEELERSGAFKVFHGRTLAAESLRLGIHPDTLAGMSPKEVASQFGADAAISGEVTSARKEWWFVAATDHLAFRAQCVEAGTGKTLWTAEGGGFSLVRVDVPTARKVSRRIAEWLASGEDFHDAFATPEERMIKRHPLLGDVPAPTGRPPQTKADLPFRR